MKTRLFSPLQHCRLHQDYPAGPGDEGDDEMDFEEFPAGAAEAATTVGGSEPFKHHFDHRALGSGGQGGAADEQTQMNCQLHNQQPTAGGEDGNKSRSE